MSSRFLPPNAQPYPRALADAHDTHGRLSAHLGLIPQIGRTHTPTEWVPWILRNRGLEPLMPHVDWQTLLDHGQAWLRIRGTPHASVQALGWAGWAIRFEGGTLGMPDYDAYHIHLDRIPTRPELETIIAVERLSKNTDSHFYRLVHGWDDRRVRPGFTRFGSHIFGVDSGIHVRDDWPILSFKARAELLVRTGTQAHAADALTVAAYAGGRHIRGGFSSFPSVRASGPTWGIAISDTALARHSAGWSDLPWRDVPWGDGVIIGIAEGIRPLAGIVGGSSRFGDRQAVFQALRLVPGERPRPGFYRFGATWRLPRVERLMAVRPSGLAGARVTAGAQARSTAQIPPAHAAFRVTASPVAQSGEWAYAGAMPLHNIASWSALSWRGSPWGAAPGASISISETD